MDKIKQNIILRKILLVVAVFFFIWAIIGSLSSNNFPKISSDNWQAVFLENNQVYFGKLSNSDSKYVTLTNVYYLRTADTLNNEKTSSNINLVKLGGEFHGPEDRMFISKDKILFWENLTDSSSVVKTIISNKGN